MRRWARVLRSRARRRWLVLRLRRAALVVTAVVPVVEIGIPMPVVVLIAVVDIPTLVPVGILIPTVIPTRIRAVALCRWSEGTEALIRSALVVVRCGGIHAISGVRAATIRWSVDARLAWRYRRGMVLSAGSSS